MEVTVLIDNTPAYNDNFYSEHGLSLYIELSDKKILMDTGLSGKAFYNAQRLGIDVSKIDTLVLSHGHNDHTGGLAKFIELNKKADIYVSKHIVEYEYFSDRHGKLHSLSPDRNLIKENKKRFHLIEKNTLINNEIYLVFNNVEKSQHPSGNKYLHIKKGDGLQAYEADDELALAILRKNGMVIISPCSHSGLLNITDSCIHETKCNDVVAFVGGLHLLDEESENDNVKKLAETINESYTNMHIYSGHCTGNKACNTMFYILGEKFTKFKTGDVYLF